METVINQAIEGSLISCPLREVRMSQYVQLMRIEDRHQILDRLVSAPGKSSHLLFLYIKGFPIRSVKPKEGASFFLYKYVFKRIIHFRELKKVRLIKLCFKMQNLAYFGVPRMFCLFEHIFVI